MVVGDKFIPPTRRLNENTGKLEPIGEPTAFAYESKIINNKTGEIIFEIDTETGIVLEDNRDADVKKKMKEDYGIPE